MMVITQAPIPTATTAREQLPADGDIGVTQTDLGVRPHHFVAVCLCRVLQGAVHGA